MFAYCGNNSLNNSDPIGYYRVSVLDDDPGYPLFITNQEASGVGDKRFGVVSVAHGGCGAIATYNANLILDSNESFDSVLGYYNKVPYYRLTAGGLLGMFPTSVASYFKEKGKTVIMTDSLDGIDIYSQTADACIMYYVFPTEFAGAELVGAHFVTYHRSGNKYVGYNTESRTGITIFAAPSDYAYRNNRLYAIGIFIYE